MVLGFFVFVSVSAPLPLTSATAEAGAPIFQSIGADDSVRPKRMTCRPSVDECRLLALPLGELSPQVTERASQPFSNNKIDWSVFPLSVLAALGHLSQRERQAVRCVKRRAG